MTSGTPTPERYTPEERRAKLRAFADRMLDHLEAMAPPQEVAEAERGLRTSLLIERLYNRVDASERTAWANPKPPTDEEIAAEAAKSRADWAAKLNRMRLEREAIAAQTTASLKAKDAVEAAARSPETVRDEVKDIADERENRLIPGFERLPKPEIKPEIKSEPALARFIDTQDPLTAPVQHWRPPERPDSGSG